MFIHSPPSTNNNAILCIHRALMFVLTINTATLQCIHGDYAALQETVC